MVNLEKIVAEFKQAMQSLYGERLDKIVLYGSYARGDFNADSDIDFLVVLKDEEIDLLKELRVITPLANAIAIGHGIYIAPKPTTYLKAKSPNSPFYYWVNKEGKLVA